MTEDTQNVLAVTAGGPPHAQGPSDSVVFPMLSGFASSLQCLSWSFLLHCACYIEGSLRQSSLRGEDMAARNVSPKQSYARIF